MRVIKVYNSLIWLIAGRGHQNRIEKCEIKLEQKCVCVKGQQSHHKVVSLRAPPPTGRLPQSTRGTLN